MPKVKKRKSLSKKPSKKLQKSKTKPVRKKPKKKLVTKKHNVTIKHHVTIKPAKIEKPKPTTEIVMQPILLKVVLPKEIKDTNQEFIPDLNKLPPWESRQFLKNLIFNKGLKFYCMSRASPEFQGVMSLLDKSPYQDVSGHFVISIKSLNQIVGALDGYLVDDVLVLGNTYAKSDRRAMQLLLYAAALTKRESKYVVCSTRVSKLSIDFIGMLNLLGRGFGMYAIPSLKSTFVFLRRINKEGPVTSGQEVAHVLRSLRSSGDSEIRTAVFEFNKKGLVSLIPLPMSPDKKENLYEVKETGISLGFSNDSLNKLIELLNQSKLNYQDLTPETLF